MKIAIKRVHISNCQFQAYFMRIHKTDAVPLNAENSKVVFTQAKRNCCHAESYNQNPKT